MAELTPMRKQYLEMKQKYPDCILFFRLGDFYEMFDEDARTVSRELELTLTTRDRKKDIPEEERVPMCGVPYHSYQPYLAKLVMKGYKVAICEQMEDPATAQGLVERDIVRIVTSGTAVESELLDEDKNNYIAAVYLSGSRAGVAFCDISTGECSATAFSGGDAVEHLMNELGRFAPKEAILSQGALASAALTELLRQRLNCQVEQVAEDCFALEQARALVERQFENPSAVPEGKAEATQAVGALLSYLYETQRTDLSYIRRLDYYADGRFMELDLTARRNLELTETLRTKEKKGSLLWVLDKTKTAMGSRLLRQWLEKPLLSPTEIGRRLDAVEALTKDGVARSEIALCLKEITDLERLISRVSYGSAGGRDLAAIAGGLKQVPKLKQLLESLDAPLLRSLREKLDGLPELTDLLERAIVDDPPFTIREGGIIQPGYDETLDGFRDVRDNAQKLIANIEAETRENCGIKNIRIKYNKVFGYYIEVSRGQADLVPKDWVRKQTTVNSERFINEDLKRLESNILTAQDRIVKLEYDLFCDLRQKCVDAVEQIQATASAVAAVDVLCDLAQVAVDNHYCKPEVDDSTVVDITDGRHPVVEQMQKDSLFVPNDTFLDCGENTLAIITGPNMAGKSTYMRQVALICLMAQVGSFVPAKRARIGVLDRVFTRIGASDDLAGGQSTFMVEMTEVAELLKNATSRSLLILDEIGRGTSTYDGMSIARAVLEYCADHKKLGAKTLFATHYHELTALEGQLDGVKNYNVAAKKRGDGVVFLRKIVRGGADQSYGIEVAKLAGVPTKVLTRARAILAELEQGAAALAAGEAAPAPAPEEPEQCSFGDMTALAVAEELRRVDINTLTPIEAMNLVFQLKRKLELG